VAGTARASYPTVQHSRRPPTISTRRTAAIATTSAG